MGLSSTRSTLPHATYIFYFSEMRRIGPHTLDEFPSPVDCERCGRAGSYRLDGLLARFGADAALPDVLLDLAACERWAS